MALGRIALACLACLALARANAPAVNRGYVFIAPKRLIAGETENVCLSLHNLEPPVHLSVDLLVTTSLPEAATQQTVPEEEHLGSVKATLKSGIEKCLGLRVTTSTKYSVAKLRLRLKFDKYPDYEVDTEKKIFIDHDALVTFVETDKPVYKPGQEVNIRILTLKHDLKPHTKIIPKIWIENPSEVRVAQWSNVTTDTGMTQLSFPLSPEPSCGTWKIKVEKSRPQLIHTASFEVKKYVLPRFQVTISSPNYILADAENATWRVCARYSYGEPVRGTLLLSLRPQTPIWKRKQTIGEINYEEKLGAGSDGCTNYTVSAQALGLPHWKIAPNNVILLANFTEANSGVVETASSRTLVMHQPLKLEFSPHTPKYFKPGLPYHGKLRVLLPDASKPAPNERIQLCLRIRRKDEWQRSVVDCKNFTSSKTDGFLDFLVPPQHKNIVLLSFVATALDYPTKYYSPDKRWRVFVDQPSAYIDVEPWFSASASYLSVTRGYQALVCGEKYSFNVMYTSASGEEPEPVSFHYSINSKSDLLVFGHVKYRPRKDTIIDYSEFRNVLGTSGYSNASNSDLLVHRFPLSVKVTASMAPISELLLYYVRADGEVVSSSYSIDVGQCFENKVETAWQTDRLSPGSLARLNLRAAPWSLCGISALDRSTSFLAAKGPHLVDADGVFARLKPFHLQPDSPPVQSTWAHCDKSSGENATDEVIEQDGPEDEIDHLPKPVAAAQPRESSRRRRHSVTYNVAANYVDAVQAFDDFGTIVMSDLILESRPCPPWRLNYGHRRPMSPEDIDEPDRMLKAVKAMPLAFQFSGLGSSVAEASAMGQDVAYTEPTTLDVQTSSVIRSYFPETWIWELVATGKEGMASVERKLPDTITDWVSNAVCVSARNGLVIGQPRTVTAFQAFFLDYSLPYSVKRGEQMHLQVSLFNYMPHSLPVVLRLVGHKGLELLANTTTNASYCVNSRDSVVHEFILTPRDLGEINVTVSAETDSEFASAQTCGPETLLYTRDEIVKPLLVKPEGFSVEVSLSALLCPRDFSDDSFLGWELSLPEPDDTGNWVINGSARGHVSIVGDVIGPALENLEKLVRLPMGCGEQNMILFVPNIHAVAYLDAINRQTTSELRAKALRNMQKGYQRELNYRHPDGSYSAFGANGDDNSGSMWLTAFVVKSFTQARHLIQIDERDLKLSVMWIMRRQLENGCFPVVGQVFHKDMKGGLREEDGSSTALTAYVLIALLESGQPLSAALINNALYCLEKAISVTEEFYTPENIYTAVVTTYAYAVLQHPRASNSICLLLELASRQNDAVWWEDKSRPDSLALSIEMTAYALLSIVKVGNEEYMLDALRAVRWLSRQRNTEGGFISTQDTVIGLEALTKYALMNANSTMTDLSILVTANDIDRLFKMNEDNRMVMQRLDLPTLPTSLEVFVEGEGCVLVQSSFRYNKAKASGSEAFDLTARAETVSINNLETVNDRCAIQRLTVCCRYKLADEESNMAVLEISMVSGFVPDRSTLNDLLHEPATGVKRFEEDHDTVAIYFDKLTAQKTCIGLQANRENVIDHAAPGHIKLYDYYQQELTVSTDYKFVDVCDKKAPEHPPSGPKAEEAAAARIQPKNDRQLDNRMSIEELPKDVQVVMREKKLDPEVTKQWLVPDITPSPKAVEPINEGSGGEPDGELFSPQPILSVDQDVIDEGFSPAFVNVDHELETPPGIEGPVPVYVDAPSSTSATTAHPETTTVNETTVSNNIGGEESERFKKNFCPRCEETFPSDFSELICGSNTIMKVAVRRNHRFHLLLSLHSPDRSTRLRMTSHVDIGWRCPCKPLNTPGIMALFMRRHFEQDSSRMKNIELRVGDSVIALPPTAGMPPELRTAWKKCLK